MIAEMERRASADGIAVTLFSIPKAFAGHAGLIQLNAVQSWRRLSGAEVILFGDEEGIEAAARAAGVRHERDIARNERGTPLVSDAFERVRALARGGAVVYVNADIIFTPDLSRAVSAMSAGPLRRWLLVGQRHDIDISTPVEFGDGWDDRLRRDVAARGALHGKAGIDYFAFPKDLPVSLPPMAVGRPGWDSWLVHAARSAGIPLVDATAAVLAVHQNHPSAYRSDGPEARANRAAAGGYCRMGTIRDADWRLRVDAQGNVRISRRLAGRLWFAPPVRACLALKRALSG